MTSLVVEVARPRFWWRADGDRLGRWSNLQASPDETDGYQRHDDRDEQRWDLIADAVVAVGDALAAGAWTPLLWEGGATCAARIEVSSPPQMTDTEIHIVRSWFKDTQAVCSDPWNSYRGVQNGRHRLWGVLPHARTRPVPVRGTSLMFANPDDAGEYDARPGTTKRWQTVYAGCLDELYFTTWFDHYDPVNKRFVVALQESVRGQWPDPTALGHDVPEPLEAPSFPESPHLSKPSRIERLLDWMLGPERTIW